MHGGVSVNTKERAGHTIRQTRIVIELDAGPSLGGSVLGDGSGLRFEGWLGLIRALSEVVDAGEAGASVTNTKLDEGGNRPWHNDHARSSGR